jgi:hypothetical protein
MRPDSASEVWLMPAIASVTSAWANPYVGPRAVHEGEPFYGRRREIEDLADRLIGGEIALLYAPSGAGKTSLIQAGLIPRLKKEQDIEVLPVIHVGRIPPPSTALQGNRYVWSTLASLKYGLAQNQKGPGVKREVMTPERFAEADLENYLQERLKPDVDSLLIFDQFEEVLTLNPADRDAKTDFFRVLGRILEKPRRWALFVIREEYLGALERYRRLLPQSVKVTYRLESLTEAAAIEAIQKPAEDNGVVFTNEAVQLVSEYLRQVLVVELDGRVTTQEGPYIEPLLLQVVCTEIWEAAARDNARTITRDRIPNERNLESVLQSFYLKAVDDSAKATGIRREQILDWCPRLITEQNTRGMVRRGPTSTEGIPNAVVDALERNRLVRPVPQAGQLWYELTHDRLIAAIQEANRPEPFRPTLRVFSQQAFNEWLHDTAYFLSRDRRLRIALNEPLEQRLEKIVSSLEEERQDVYSARLLFACQVLDGDIDLARQDLPELFKLLEGIWLSEVLRFKAYFIWEKKGGGWDPGGAEHNYYEACRQVIERLRSPVKATRLGALGQYIEEKYLADGGCQLLNSSVLRDLSDMTDTMQRLARR